MRSVTWLCSGITCDGTDQYMMLMNRAPGAGIIPAGPCLILGYQLISWLRSSPNTYAVCGKTQPYGDYITDHVFGAKDTGLKFYPAGQGFHFIPPATLPQQPGDGSDQLHLHYMGASGEPNPTIEFTMFYRLDSDTC